MAAWELDVRSLQLGSLWSRARFMSVWENWSSLGPGRGGGNCPSPRAQQGECGFPMDQGKSPRKPLWEHLKSHPVWLGWYRRARRSGNLQSPCSAVTEFWKLWGSRWFGGSWGILRVPMSSRVTLPHLPFRGPWYLETRAPSWILPFLPVGRDPVGLLVGKEVGEGEKPPHFPSQVIREMEGNVRPNQVQSMIA